MTVRWKPCDHQNHTITSWRDAAGLRWVDRTCGRCGRVWRRRARPFGRTPRPAEEAAA